MGSQKLLENEKQSLQDRLISTSDQLRELKENYNNLQGQSSIQLNELGEKFSKERRDLNDKLDQLNADHSNNNRLTQQLEHQKESLKEQILQREHALQEKEEETAT